MNAACPRPAAEALPDTTMHQPVTIHLPVLPAPSMSANGRSRGNWQGHAYDAADVLRSCTYWLRHHYPGLSVPTPVSIAVCVTWPTGRRRYDVDSLASLVKQHQDALVVCGVLDGDGPNQIVRATYAQRRQDKHHDPGVMFVITRETT